MTSDFDNVQWLIDYLKKNPDDGLGWIILSGIIDGIHSLAHDIGDEKVKIYPSELQSANLLSVCPYTKRWMEMLRDFMYKKRFGDK